MRAVVLIAVAIGACGGDGGGGIRVTASYTITQLDGTGPSDLDVLNGQQVTIDLVMDGAAIFHAQSGDCRSTIFTKQEPQRTAGGPMASTVQTKILDVIPDWDVSFEICNASSRVVIGGSTNELNTSHGCLMIPTSARVRDGAMDPQLTTFVAAGCSTTILDVARNRVLGASGFTVSFDTGGTRQP